MVPVVSWSVPEFDQCYQIPANLCTAHPITPQQVVQTVELIPIFDKIISLTLLKRNTLQKPFLPPVSVVIGPNSQWPHTPCSYRVGLPKHPY